MRFTHHRQLPPERRAALFRRLPEPVDASERELLAVGLGASLYVPGDRPDLVGTIRRRVASGVCSLILDLEDAVADGQVETALDRVVEALDTLAGDPPEAALFVRIRHAGHVEALEERLGAGLGVLTGLVLPKFDPETGERLLARIRELGRRRGAVCYAMPVLESPAVVHRESRDAELERIAAVLDAHRDLVLAVRLGATDMCSRFGIRRGPDHTVYDVRVVADVLAAVVNRLGRRDGSGFAVTGTVWEYYPAHQRMLRTQLRVTPFEQHGKATFRRRLVESELDGLVEEVILDAVNGITGKSVIHPSHVGIVHALSVVSAEEYDDAVDVLGVGTGGEEGGVLASGHRNKMNERRPHRTWAEVTLLRARAFGVAAPEVTTADLLEAVGSR